MTIYLPHSLYIYDIRTVPKYYNYFASNTLASNEFQAHIHIFHDSAVLFSRNSESAMREFSPAQKWPALSLSLSLSLPLSSAIAVA